MTEVAAAEEARQRVNTQDDIAKEDESSQEVSVWDIVGTPPSGLFFRFGDASDQAMFRVLRIIATIDAMWVPALLSFGQLQWLQAQTLHPLCLFLDIVMNCIYAFGVVMQLRTSVVLLAVAQEWVNPGAIFFFRMKSGNFWMDFLSVFGAFWWSPAFPCNIAALRILRLWRLSAGADDLYELHLAQLTSEDAFKNFLQLAWQLLLVIHNFTCSWFFATTLSATTWEADLKEDPRYLGGSLSSIYLVYFSDGAAMLAGWGGPPPISSNGLYSRCELIVWSIAAPISSLCTAWVFAQLLEVVQQASAATDKHLNKLANLSSVLDSLFVPQGLKQRCLRYHSFLSIHNANKAEYDSLFSSMSLNLQQDIKVHLFDGLVREAPFFREVPEVAMKKLVLAFEEEVYGPGQYIFHKGDYGEELFFIMRGVVEVLVDGIPVAQLHVGKFFGELALVLDQPRAATIRAKSFCMFAKLTREFFNAVMEEDPVVKKFIMNEIAWRQANKDAPPPPVEEHPQVTTPLLSDRGDQQAQDPGSPAGRSRANQAMFSDAPVRKTRFNSMDDREAKQAAPKSGAGGVFSHHDKMGGLDAAELSRLMTNVGRMTHIIERFQGKFDGIEIRLRNMEVYANRANAGAARSGA